MFWGNKKKSISIFSRTYIRKWSSKPEEFLCIEHPKRVKRIKIAALFCTDIEANVFWKKFTKVSDQMMCIKTSPQCKANGVDPWNVSRLCYSARQPSWKKKHTRAPSHREEWSIWFVSSARDMKKQRRSATRDCKSFVADRKFGKKDEGCDREMSWSLN